MEGLPVLPFHFLHVIWWLTLEGPCSGRGGLHPHRAICCVPLSSVLPARGELKWEVQSDGLVLLVSLQVALVTSGGR